MGNRKRNNAIRKVQREEAKVKRDVNKRKRLLNELAGKIKPGVLLHDLMHGRKKSS